MKKNIKVPGTNEDFYQEVYQVISNIPVGKVIAYGEIALLLGRPQNSRMVGRALKLVPPELCLPCHRVVNSQGRLAPGWAEQKSLLEEEGVIFKSNGDVNMKKSRWEWENVS